MYRKKFIDKLRDKYQSGGVKYNTMDKIQDTLTVGGLTPGIGIIPDAVNTGISAIRSGYNYLTGDKARAKSQMGDLALNAGSMIPGLGQAAGIAKLGTRGAKVMKGIKVAKKVKKGKAAFSLAESIKLPTPGLGKGPLLALNAGENNIDFGLNLNKMQTGGMYDQMQQYQQGGMALPGGEMQPIPGSDAVQFNGQTHDEGGIMMDSQTEVEDGETMDKVSMAKKGGKRDYFFSSYLKKGGRSFADMHKDILRDGGDQNEINLLAKMQEQAAGRNPNKVQTAKLGGVMKYQTGGELETAENAYNTHEATKPTPPTFNLKEPKFKKTSYFGRTPTTAEMRADKKKEEAFQKELESYNNAKAEHEQAMSNYQTELSEWENTESELSDAIEQEQMIVDQQEREVEQKAAEQKAKNDELVARGKELNIPVSEMKTMSVKELENAIKQEELKQTTDLKPDPEREGTTQGQTKETIGGKNYRVDKGSDTEKLINALGDNFPDYWMGKVDQEVLDAAGITDFDAMFNEDGESNYDTVIAYQKAYNAKYGTPDNPKPLGEDGIFGNDTTETAIEKNTTISQALDEVVVEENKTKEIPRIPMQNTVLPSENEGELIQDTGPAPVGGNTDRFDEAAKDLLNLDIQSVEDYEKAEDNLQYNDDTDQWELKPQLSNFTLDTNREIGPQTDSTITKDDVLDDGVTETRDPSPQYTMITNPALTEQTTYTDSEGTEYTLDANNNWFEGDRQLDYDPSESGDLTKVKQNKDRSARIPGAAYLGMAAGIIPAAYSLFHKQPAAQQAEYTPGFKSPVVAKEGRSPRLERYDYNLDISNVGAEVRGMNKYIETSGGGPANMINKMMAFSKGQDAKANIRAAETRANIGVQNTEAQLKQQMTLDNMRRSQQASIFNAQMIRSEAARKDQIDESNTARRQKRQDDMEFQKYAGVSSFASSLQTGFGDILDYKADMAMADAIGSDTGVYNRSTLAYLDNGGRGNLVWDEETKSYKESNKFGGLRRMRNYKK